jgi:hypothetical protein
MFVCVHVCMYVGKYQHLDANMATTIRLRQYGYGNSATAIWLRQYSYGNTATAIRLRQYGYGNTATAIWLRQYGYGNTATAIRLRQYGYGYGNTATAAIITSLDFSCNNTCMHVHMNMWQHAYILIHMHTHSFIVGCRTFLGWPRSQERM